MYTNRLYKCACLLIIVFSNLLDKKYAIYSEKQEKDDETNRER